MNDGHEYILSLLIRLTDNKNFSPSILVEEEVLEDDRANEDLQLALVDQIVDGGVHEGELLAHQLVTVLNIIFVYDY